MNTRSARSITNVLLSLITALLGSGCMTPQPAIPRQLHVAAVNKTAALDLDFTRPVTTTKVEFTNVRQRADGIELNGRYEHGGGPSGYRAVIHDSSINYEEYTVALLLKPTDTTGTHNTLFCGGPSYRWFSLRTDAEGSVVVTFENQDIKLPLQEGRVHPGQWTLLVVSVSKARGTILVSVDGRKAESLVLPAGHQPRVIGSDAASTDKAWTFTNYSDGGTYHGLVREMVVYPTALSELECEALVGRK